MNQRSPVGPVGYGIVLVMVVLGIGFTVGMQVLDAQKDAVQDEAAERCTEQFNTTEWRWMQEREGYWCEYEDVQYQPEIILRGEDAQ